MIREERFEIIAISRKEVLLPLADEARKSLEVHPVRDKTPPHTIAYGELGSRQASAGCHRQPISNGVKVIKQNTALVMMRAVDSVEREVFNLGEVLVSEAEVEVRGVLGYSQILGDDTEKALAGAILDAVCEIEHPLREEIIKVLNQEKIYYKKERAKEYAKIKSTKVEFEAMAKR
jgi:alpha-D-ribose 1-methylphosphonate 5-triphosphate synthase subunit PhnG